MATTVGADGSDQAVLKAVGTECIGNGKGAVTRESRLQEDGDGMEKVGEMCGVGGNQARVEE